MAEPLLTPVRRRSVVDDVTEQLRDQIVAGRLQVGDDLPGERALADALGVSRPTVRSALRALEQRGLVAIRQGGTTTVRDYRRTGGLDLIPTLLTVGGELDVALVADLMRTRSAIAPHLARAAAEADATRREDAELRELAAVIARTDDAVEAQHRVLTFWSAIVDRSRSTVYRLLFNGLRAAFEPGLAALAEVLRAESMHPTASTDLAEAIVRGDPDAAHAAAESLLAHGRDAVLAAIDTLATTPDHLEHP